jgi:ubiquinone/menaquinone biosynthesis C-methylase UbiE
MKMIENIPTEGLYDESYVKIMNDFEKLRSKQLKNSYKINMLGTNNQIFSIVYFVLNPFRKNLRLKKYINFVLKKILEKGRKNSNTLKSYTNVFWTKDVVESSTLSYPVRRTEYPWAIKKGKLNKPMKILDVGSGISTFPIYLASKGHEVNSIDFDEILMNRVSPELAKLSGVNVKYSFGDATKIDFKEESFDRVFCISTIEHLEEELENEKYVNYHKKNLDITAISEMLRVLKPGGLLIMTFDWSENIHDHRSYRLNDIWDRVLKPYNKFLINDQKPIIDWDELKEKHISSWKAFPPYNYITEGWAIGVILKK